MNQHPYSFDEVELRPLSELDDAGQWRLLAIRNEEGVRKAMFRSGEIAQDDHRRWLESLGVNRSIEMFAVYARGQLAGAVGLTEFDRIERRANWTFYLTGALQGKGVGPIGEFKFIDLVFNDLKLEKLNGEVLEFNTKVLKLHQKFGFVREGIRRKHVRRDGRWIDCVLIGLTKEEWFAIREDVKGRYFG